MSSFSNKVSKNSIAGSIIVSNLDLSVDVHCLYAVSLAPFLSRHPKMYVLNAFDPGHCSQLPKLQAGGDGLHIIRA